MYQGEIRIPLLPGEVIQLAGESFTMPRIDYGSWLDIDEKYEALPKTRANTMRQLMETIAAALKRNYPQFQLAELYHAEVGDIDWEEVGAAFQRLNKLNRVGEAPAPTTGQPSTATSSTP